MNNKAQTLGLGIIFFIMFFLIGMLCVNLLKPEITTARSSAGLNCAGDISDGTKLACLAVDIVLPYFFIIIFSLCGASIMGRLT